MEFVQKVHCCVQQCLTELNATIRRSPGVSSASSVITVPLESVMNLLWWNLSSFRWQAVQRLTQI